MKSMSSNERPTSWVVTCIATGEVFEIFGQSNADKARQSPFVKVETAAEYLGRINSELEQQK